MRNAGRLVAPAVVGWIVVGILIGIPAALFPSTVVLWLVAAMGIGAAVLHPRFRSVLAIVSVTVAVSALLVTSAAVVNAAQSPPALVEAASHHRFVTLTAVLDVDTHASAVSSAQSRAQSSPTAVTITRVSVGSESVDGVSIPALVFGFVPRAGIGASITVSGTMTAAEAGDRTRFLVFARGSAQLTASPPWFLDWANELRLNFQDAASQLPGDGGALLPGLSIGDTSAVSDSLDTAMKVTSLSHLTAVSGANCAVVVGLVMLLLGWFGASRRVRVYVALAVLVGFVILVTPSASVLRAAVMAALVLGSLATGRPTRGLAILSVAVIVLVVSDPWLSRDYGFILSVLATAGLLVLAGPVAKALSAWLPMPIAAVVSIPLAAQLACQPVLILLNPAIPLYGVLANLLAEPAAPLATVLGLIGCAFLPILEPLGKVCTYLAWVPSAWIAAVARFFADAPGSQAPWLTGAIGVASVVIVTGLALAALLRPRSRSRRLIAASLAVGLVCYASSVVGAAFGRDAALPPNWQIAACDIGQGDAVLVRSQGAVALIDTGPRPERLARCLDDLGIGHIDLLVLTHYDLDHVGGTSAVFGRVTHAIVGPVSDPSDTALREALVGAGASVEQVSRGRSGMLGELRWEVLWPPARLGTIEPGNPASVTVRFDGVGACSDGCLSSLFLGDLGEEAQSRMLGVAHPAEVDVVKVAHHGSADQYERLYQQLRAKVGVIGVGADNNYGHPTDALLGMLTRAGTLITRTDLEGMILLSPDANGGVQVWTERAPDRDVGAH
jgi:competence protein ComEC